MVGLVLLCRRKGMSGTGLTGMRDVWGRAAELTGRPGPPRWAWYWVTTGVQP